MQSHTGLANFLRFVSDSYKLEICINDFVGFLSADKELNIAMQPFSIHKNVFCMHVKSNSKLWDRCLSMKKLFYNKSQKLKCTYYGMCYCGIEEYVVPILKDNYVIGVILAGEYTKHRKISEYRIRKISKEYNLDYDSLIQKFYATVNEQPICEQDITALLGIAADYLSSIYANIAQSTGSSTLNLKKQLSTENYILSHAVEFIKQNFTERLTLKDIATFCHCSESYISHIFKKNMKVSIKGYINTLKIEEAKLLLLNSDANISEIANRVGFNDPNYFSLVFREFCGISATEYRSQKG